MIQYKKISVVEDTTESRMRALHRATKKLLIAAGFEEFNYPVVGPGEYGYFRQGGHESLRAEETTVLKWKGIGLVVFFSQTDGSVRLSPFVITKNSNGEYPKWNKDAAYISDVYPGYNYNGAIRDTSINNYNVMSILSPKNASERVVCCSIDCYRDDNLMVIEFGTNPDTTIWNEDFRNHMDITYAFYSCNEKTLIIKDSDREAPAYHPPQHILKYSDTSYLNVNQAMPFTAYTDDKSDYVICPRLYLLDFTIKTAEYETNGTGQLRYFKRRTGKQRLFKLMGQTFFYISGKTAIIP